MFKAHIDNNRIQSCIDHSRNTANHASVRLSSVDLLQTAYLCGLLHDVGKFTNEFNSYIEDAAMGNPVVKGSVIHSFAGVRMILERYHHAYNHSDINDSISNITAEIIATAVGSHHGLFDIFGGNRSCGFTNRMEKQPDYDHMAINNFFSQCTTSQEVDHIFSLAKEEINRVLLKIRGISNDSKEMMFYLSLLERLVSSSVIDGDRRDTADFMSNGVIACRDYDKEELTNMWSNALHNLEIQINLMPATTEIDKARMEMSDFCASFADEKGAVFRLNLPTGGGKTLSSLRYALRHAKLQGKKRIIFAVPLLSVLDQNAKVIRKSIQNDTIILEHHSNVVIDDNENYDEVTNRELLIDTWDSPIIITTLVQLLNTMFDGKTSSVRRFQSLSNSVIVIDEVQSVPQKMISMFNLAINFLSSICNTTVILCSATQPRFELNSRKMVVDEREMIPPDKMKIYRQVFKRTTATFVGEQSIDDIANLSLEHLEKFGSVLVICNTKKEASELFSIIRNRCEYCYHLSTSMCMEHRLNELAIINEQLTKNEPLICISTQLIEAGVDISFGSVIRLTAGIENIVQAAGRCNRNAERNNISPVSIVSLKGENLSHAGLKEIKRGQDITGELVNEFRKHPDSFDDDLLSEKAIQYYYERLFHSINAIRGYTDYSVDDVNLFDLLSLNQAFVPESHSDFTVRQAFKTAGDYFEVFDTCQVPVIVPYKRGKEVIGQLLSKECQQNIGYLKKIVSEAKGFTVNLFQYQVELLQSQKAIYSDNGNNVFILDSNYYDDSLGVIMEKKEECECNML